MSEQIEDEFSHLKFPAQARYRKKHADRVRKMNKRYESSERGREIRKQINERRKLKRHQVRYEQTEE